MGESQRVYRQRSVSQSAAAAGLLWLSAGRGDHSRHVAGGPLSKFSTRIN